MTALITFLTSSVFIITSIAPQITTALAAGSVMYLSIARDLASFEKAQIGLNTTYPRQAFEKVCIQSMSSIMILKCLKVSRSFSNQM